MQGSTPGPANRLWQYLAGHPRAVLLGAVLGLLLPFWDKPFNIDDPLFVWAARQIHAHPADPYGFVVNWYGTAMPMAEVAQNPPLAAYYLAGAALFLGWSEGALHLAFLLPAVGVILGTYRLAKGLCRQPLLAALTTLSMPVFLISSTTLMSDVLTLAFWVWAMVWWLEGLARKDGSRLCLAGLLMGLAALTKYFGFCLVPLLFVYTLLHGGGPTRRLAWLLIPLGMFAAYQCWFMAQYGREPLSAAASYANSNRTTAGASLAELGLTGLGFVGAALAGTLFSAPALWRGRWLAGCAAGGIAVAGLALWHGGLFRSYLVLAHGRHTALEIQVSIWAVGGVLVLAAMAGELWGRRAPASWLLVGWLAGTFLFAAFLNWTINGRSLLPMAPGLGILLARQWDRLAGRPGWQWRAWLLGSGLAASTGLGWLAARADYQLATAIRECAREICAKYAHAPRPLWFQGHWGFQYYMSESGALALDLNNSPLLPGDAIVITGNNYNVTPPSEDKTDRLDRFEVAQSRWLATLSVDLGANFYSSEGGVLPFVFGRVPPETDVICTLRPVPASAVSK